MKHGLEILAFVFIAIVGSVLLYRARRIRALELRADLICGIDPESHDNSGRPARLNEVLLSWLDRQNLLLDRNAIGLLSAAAIFPFLSTAPFFGWKAGLAVDIVAIAGYVAFANHRSKRRTRDFTQRLPQFLDRVRRLTMAGHTFVHAFIEAAETADPIVKFHIGPVVRQFKHGVPLASSIENLARKTEIVELHMLAAYVRANAKFGGRVSQTLASLIAQINNRHRLEREVKAATSETRASAIILFVLTVGVIGITSFLNPQYPHFFLNDETGRWILAGIVGWPLVGVLVMKRILSLEY